MKYYRLVEQNLSKKIFGTYPNFISLISDDVVRENFINYYGALVGEREFYVPPLQLKGKSSKITNMLPSLAGGYGMSLIVDSNLKRLLERSNYYKIRFTKTILITLENHKIDYWFVSAEQELYDAISYNKCIFFDKRYQMFDKSKWIELKFNSKQEFLKYKKEKNTFVNIDNISFFENLDFDFFGLQNVNDNAIIFFVSEKLKNEIENEKLTGMQFLELNERWP